MASGVELEVSLDPSLRSADGRPLARVGPWRVRVQSSRVLAVVPVGAKYLDLGFVDAHVHLFVVYSSPMDTNELKGRLWYVPDGECASRDSVPLAVVVTRRIVATDPYQVSFAGGYDRDQRLDSLRRVVELRASAAAPRGCIGELRSPILGSTARRSDGVRIIPVFRFVALETRSVDGPDAKCENGRCEAGPVSISFSQPVDASALQAHLRINGVAPRLANQGMGNSWALPDTLHAGGHLHITIDSSLTSYVGERLAAPLDTTITGSRARAALGYAKGQVALPRSSRVLLACATRARTRYAS